MKLCIFLVSLLLCEMLFSQATFSKLIDLELGQDNYLLDFEAQDSFLFATTKHLCPLDTTNYNFITCTGLSKFDNNGNVVHKILLDSFYPEGLNRLLIQENKLLLSGHFHEEFTGRPTALKYFDLILSEDSVYLFSNESNTIVNNEGIIKYNGNYYLYGTKLLIDQSKQYSNIIKINSKGEIVWNNIYSRGSWKNEIYDLQNTIDGKLIYFQYFNDGVGSLGESGFQLIKIDTNGLILDSFEFEDIGIDNPRLLASSDGNVYFTSQDPPFPHTIPSNGRINKIDKDLDSIAWSILLPTNPFIDGHRYKVYDYLETSDGDIVICGTVWEEGPDGPTGTPDNHTWNGFIASVTTSGDLKWLRIYRHPNHHPLLQSPDFGEYRPSYLNKIYESSNNNFIVAGTVYYDPYQENALPETENKSSIWLMSVNTVGCIENEECAETIILNGVDSQESIFQIGTSWTFEVKKYPFPIYTTHQTFTITDTTEIENKKVFMIENDFDNQIEYMYENNNQVYFWDDVASTFRLHYDFDEIIQYASSWIGMCNTQDSGTAAISINSISDYVLNDDTIKIQNISISNNGSLEDDIITGVYKNIGLKEFGIKLPLGLGLCDFNRSITKLRCFQSGNIFFNFVDYPCDSSWFSTSISPIENENIFLYPNPSGGIVNLEKELVGSSYRLFSLTGDLISSGIIEKEVLSIPYSGTFVIQLYNSRFSRSSIIVVRN